VNGYECGPGRSAEETSSLLKEWLPPLLEKYDIRTICDLGCGDLFWFSELGFDGEYRGYDEVIRDSAKERAAERGWYLQQANIFEDHFEVCDLAIVKDVFIHYDDKACLTLLRKIKGKAQYLCAESHDSHTWPRQATHVKVPDGKRYERSANATNLTKVLGPWIEAVEVASAKRFGSKHIAIWDMSKVNIP